MNYFKLLERTKIPIQFFATVTLSLRVVLNIQLCNPRYSIVHIKVIFKKLQNATVTLSAIEYVIRLKQENTAGMNPLLSGVNTNMRRELF